MPQNQQHALSDSDVFKWHIFPAVKSLQLCKIKTIREHTEGVSCRVQDVYPCSLHDADDFALRMMGRLVIDQA